MSTFGSILIRISVIALVGGVAGAFPVGKTAERVIPILTGLFILMSVLNPVSALRTEDFIAGFSQIRAEGEALSAAGEELSRTAFRRSISQSLEAYIQTRAADYGLRLEAKVVVSDSDDCRPVSVCLTGQWDDAGRAGFARFLSESVGIPKENQQWILKAD